jgi:hypothetical protein
MVIARFYKVNWPAPNQLIIQIQVLNFTRRGAGVRVFRLRIADFGFGSIAIRNQKSAIGNMVVHPPSNLFGGISPSYRPGSIRDTNRITYRCFLPDLTRFATVCCAVSDQNGPSYPGIGPSGGNSAPHKADFGKRAPLAPRLAQPETKIRHICFFARKIWKVQFVLRSNLVKFPKRI